MTKKGIWEPRHCTTHYAYLRHQTGHAMMQASLSVIHSLSFALAVFLAPSLRRPGPRPCVSCSEVMFIQIKTTPIS